jgi:hypothetical protein
VEPDVKSFTLTRAEMIEAAQEYIANRWNRLREPTPEIEKMNVANAGTFVFTMKPPLEIE